MRGHDRMAARHRQATCQHEEVSVGIGATALASMIIGAAGTAVSAVGQYRQAQTQAAYQEAQAREYNRAAELENQAAIRDYTEQSAAERIRQMQERDAASREAQATQREALRKKGTMLASSNASGMALEYLMADYGREEASQKERIRQDYEAKAVNSSLAVRNLRSQAQERTGTRRANVRSGSSYSSGLSALGTALGIGKTVVGALK